MTRGIRASTDTASAASAAMERRPALAWTLAIILMAVVVVATHGQSVSFGWFMDDHAHTRQLREAGWSLGDLTRACRLELVGPILDVWWLPDCTLRFFRPVAFGLMKLTYVLTGWNPTVMHIASLAWHFAVCVLLMVLLRKLGAPIAAAWAVVCLFAMHPGHVGTVQWIASQSEIMVTALLLSSLLCFGTYRGWWTADPDPVGPRPQPRVDLRTAGRGRYLAASLLLFILALGCRENAITFPGILLLTDWMVHRRRLLAAWPVYSILAAICGAYLAIRAAMLGGAALPPKPYVIPPSDPEFFGYIFSKACYYVLSEFLLLPCVPFGGLAYFSQRPVLFFGATIVVLIGLAWLCRRNWGRPAAALAPACLILGMLAVLPSFESPHHLYLPGVGWTIATMLLLRAIWRDGPGSASAWRRTAAWTLWGGAIGLFGLMTYISSLAMSVGQQVEDQVAAEIAATTPAIRDGDTLYILNLPTIAHYVKLILEHRLGVRNLRVVALTWSPRLLGMATPAELRFVNDRTIDVTVFDDQYFSGPFAELARKATGHSTPILPGRPAEANDFIATCLDGGPTGIRSLRFEFKRSLTEPGVHLFWGSRTRWACRVAPPAAE